MVVWDGGTGLLGRPLFAVAPFFRERPISPVDSAGALGIMRSSPLDGAEAQKWPTQPFLSASSLTSKQVNAVVRLCDLVVVRSKTTAGGNDLP